MALASNISTDLAAFQTAITNAGTLQGASFSVISPLLDAAKQLSTDLHAATAALDALITSGMDTGTDPALLAIYLAGQVRVTLSEDGLLKAQDYADRMVVNLTWSVGA